MDKLRMKFSKTGRAVYISHLDLMRTITRAFMRSEIPLKYSEGFNPHPNISIALPLSVGCESVCEIMDFRLRTELEPEDILTALRVQMPEGIEVLDVYASERKVKDIKWLSVSGVFEYDERSAEDMLPELERSFAAESIVISKRTKKGMSDTDIKPAIKSLEFGICDGGIALSTVISAQEPTLNPELLVSALTQLEPEIAPDFAKFRRIQVFDAEMQVFR